jgi:hypothetical protein
MIPSLVHYIPIVTTAGARLGGAPLAQGTVYLLLSKKTAHTLTAVSRCCMSELAGLLPHLERLPDERAARACCLTL